MLFVEENIQRYTKFYFTSGVVLLSIPCEAMNFSTFKVNLKRWLSQRPQLVRRLILIASLIGFVTQVTQVSIQYFRYGTTSDVAFSRPAELVPHSVAICIRYADIIDNKRLFRETGMSLKRIRSLSDAIYNDDLLTVEQIFKFTPSAGQFIASCVYRDNEWSVTEANATACMKLFNVTKFFTLESMCYKVNRIQTPKYARSAITESKFLTYVVWRVRATTLFSNASYVTPISFTGDLPSVSREFTRPIPYRNVNSDKSMLNSITLSPMDTSITRLPAPYDTKCIDLEENIPERCKKNCMISEFQRELDRVPGFELLDKPYKKFPLLYKEMQNDTIVDVIDKIWIDCRKACFFVPCQQSFTQTSADMAMGSGKSFSVSSLINQQADTSTSAQPSMTLVDYFTFVTSCFGTWFGISFMSIDPFKFFSRKSEDRFVVRFPSHTWICTSIPRRQEQRTQ